jgi:hypothetical protein
MHSKRTSITREPSWYSGGTMGGRWDTVLYCAVLCCTVLCCTVLCCTVLYCAVLCCTVLYCAVLCCAVLCCAVLCCAVLCCAVLCCAVLCCAVLCCTVLCCAVLCCTVLYSHCTVLYSYCTHALYSYCTHTVLILYSPCTVPTMHCTHHALYCTHHALYCTHHALYCTYYTLAIYNGDHGWKLGDNDQWAKMTNFEHATRIPLVMASPGLTAGRAPQLVEAIDIYPTIVDEAMRGVTNAAATTTATTSPATASGLLPLAAMPPCPISHPSSRLIDWCTEGTSLSSACTVHHAPVLMSHHTPQVPASPPSSVLPPSSSASLLTGAMRLTLSSPVQSILEREVE